MGQIEEKTKSTQAWITAEVSFIIFFEKISFKDFFFVIANWHMLLVWPFSTFIISIVIQNMHFQKF